MGFDGRDNDKELVPEGGGGSKETKPVNPGNGSGSGNPGNGSGHGSGSGGGGSADAITSYQGPVVPRGDGTYMYPSDMQAEQAANLAAIKAADNQVTLDKFDNARRMYSESDKAIEAIRAMQEREAERNAADDWQTSQQKLQSSLNAVRNASGTGWNGSFGMNAMQGYARADDMADVQLINAHRKALNQAYMEEAEAKQQNANALNELLIDTIASQGLSLDDFIAQLSSIYPGFVSGVYGPAEEIEKETDENGEEKPAKELFPYRAQSDIDKDLDTAEDLSSLTDLAKRNMQSANYDFAPLIDREKREVIAPFWWKMLGFDDNFANAVMPQEEGFVRRGNERELVGKMKKARTPEGSAASKKSGLAAYINGYNNREV